MKYTGLLKSVTFAASALVTGFSFAGEAPTPTAPASGLEFELDMGYTSEYIFRGVVWGENAFHAGVGLSGGGSALGLGDLDLAASVQVLSYGEPQGGDDSANELRINLGLAKSLGMFDIAAGVTSYSFFGALRGERLEPYIGLRTELAGLNVGVTVHDLDDGAPLGGDGQYWEITAGRSLDLGGLGLCVHGMVGTWDEFENTFCGISIGMPLSASDSITVTPHVSAISGDTPSGDDEFTAGLKIGFGF